MVLLCLLVAACISITHYSLDILITYCHMTHTYRALGVGTLNGIRRAVCSFSLPSGASAHFSILSCTYTLKNAGLKITQRWVKKGRTQRLGCFDPAVGRGGKSGGQKIKVLPYVYSNSAADFTRGGTKSFLSSHKQVSSQIPSPQIVKVNEIIT